ncbi:hypothetical protein DNU06_12570 [Putridiphycobacter roseus]|uniref:Uncharacterized protein n=1 Tax=Putridiphycobacter roseus TaxID=2219161 RepID=A0A2W1NM03_9FLAO|nr:tetratricopeptide repeat protein [Putridiphycobacter roseus]PZE16682.1 hypothetical protein DNU06_12570 [Putridiphycobacter roseus]
MKIKKLYQLIGGILILGMLNACGNTKKIQPQPKSDSNFAYKSVFHEANSQKLIGNDEQAIALFLKCIGMKPDAAAPNYAIASIYQSQSNTTKSVEYALKAYELDQENKWYAVHLADAYFGMGDYHKSAKYYDLIINKFKDRNIEFKSKLAQSYLYSNQKQKAIEVLDLIELEAGVSAMTALTKHDLYLELNDEAAANNELSNLFNEQPNNLEVGLESMDYFLQTQQIEKAKIAIDYIQRIEPENPNAYIGLAELSLNKGDIEKAFDYLSKGLPSNEIPLDKKVYLLESISNMAFDNRFPDHAMVNSELGGLLLKMIKIDAESPEILNYYGKYLMQNNQIDSARTYFNKTIEYAPSDYTYWINLLDADYITENYDQLIVDAQKAQLVFPNQPMIYLLLGIGHYEKHQYEEAETAFFMGNEMVLNDENLKVEFEYHQAKNKWKQGDKVEAKLTLEKIIEKEINKGRFSHGFAKLLSVDKDYSHAIDYEKIAVENEPNSAIYNAELAKLYFKTKDFNAAKNYIEKAISIDLDNVTYLEFYGDVNALLGNASRAMEIWVEAGKIKMNPNLKKKIETGIYHE